jgi:Ca2+-binding EF-hand superfamily protein
MKRSVPKEEVKEEFNPAKFKRNGLTDFEVREIKELFDQFDSDHSGSISLTELRQALSGIGLNDNQTFNQIWIEADRDKSGYIDLDEFMTMLVGPDHDTESKDDIRRVYDLFLGDDAGSITNGKLSINHLRRVVKEMNEQLSEQELEELIEKADKDRDGAVGFEEFYEVMTKKF